MSQGARERTNNQLVERIVDMVLWAIARQLPVTADDIQSRFGVSRAAKAAGKATA